MRMRKKKNGDLRRARLCEYFVPSELVTAGDAAACFDNDAPVYIEIGCGKGSFICENAQKNPHVNYIAIELIPDAIVLAMEKANQMQIKNIRFLICNAINLKEVFKSESIDRIYLNFSDPWPKKRHAKRRLTSPDFLAIYRDIMKPECELMFKTDNRPLFDYSLEQFPACGFTVYDVCFDLHNSEYQSENIMTEYERNFSAKGFPINRLCAKKN